jgi:hypothetical protein
MDFMFSVRRVLLFVLISVTFFGCAQSILEENRSFQLQEGDLLFQDLDCGELCDAIEKVTTGYQGMRFSHAGIVAKGDGGHFVVIEAVSSGVRVTPLKTFLGRSFDSKHHPKVVVGRLKEPYRHLIPSALEEAFTLTGKPYDRIFAIGNDAYYCSELIYEVFLRANANNPIFKLQPMTFKDPDTGVTLPAWEGYFSKLGVPVPEGQPGINPGAISRSPILTVVHKYGTPSRSGIKNARKCKKYRLDARCQTYKSTAV